MVLENKHKRFFELAKKISRKSNHPRHCLGCVISKNGKIIGFGYNQLRTHPKATNEFHMLHAEVHALLGLLPSDLYGATAYVYREHRNGKLAIAKPCPNCNKMLSDCNVREVIFTVENGYDSYKLY